MAGLTREQRAEREAAKAAEQETTVAATVTLSEDDLKVASAVSAESKASASQMSIVDHIKATIDQATVVEVEGGLLVAQEDKRAIVSDTIPLPHVDAGLRNAGFVFK